jgi:predicted dehydrogenase
MTISLCTPIDYMTSVENHWAHKLPGGVLGETGPHAVYLSLAFLNGVSEVDVHARKCFPDYPWSLFEDYKIILTAQNGISLVSLFYGSNQWASNIEIFGTRGILKLDMHARSVIKYDRPELSFSGLGRSALSAVFQHLGGLGRAGVQLLSPQSWDAHYIGIAKFVESVIIGSRPPVPSHEAVDTVRVMEMILQKFGEKYG